MKDDYGFVVAGLGELLWDVLPAGKQLGGAPCNFAFHSRQAGLESYLVSSIGLDEPGREIFEILERLGLKTSHVQSHPDFPTGTVTVKLDPSGIPAYVIHENVAWDHILWSPELESLAVKLDAVCYGSLAQRAPESRSTIRHFLEATKSKCLKVFDINLRQSFYGREDILRSLSLANVLKINEDELPLLASYFAYTGSVEDQLSLLMEKFQFKLIAYTMGGSGSLLITPEEKSYQKVPDIEVIDTVGAGDSFTATLIAGVLRGWPLSKIHEVATKVAAYVCSCNGATPEWSEDLKNQFFP